MPVRVENAPTGHEAHALAPATSANEPPAHGAHIPVPGPLAYVPIEQERHIPAIEAPVPVENEPAEQRSQALEPTDPA